MTLVMVVGESEVEMGLWASWSFARFFPEAHLKVVYDGRISPAHRRAWCELIDGLKVFDRKDLEPIVSEFLQSYPNISKWRAANRTGRKLIDPHLVSETKKVLVFDSDVLCFDDPVALKTAMSTRDYAWNEDIAYSYVANRDTLREIWNLDLPDLVNSGLMLHPKADPSTVDFVEMLLEKVKLDGRIKFSDKWFEQSIAAACVSRKSSTSAPLPRGYTVSKGATKANQVVRHYVGSPLIRPRFYCEGLPRLLKCKS